MIDELWRAKSAWRRTSVSVFLNVIGMPFDALIAMSVPGIPIWPNLTSMALGVVLLGLLFAVRRKPNLRLIEGVFLLNVVAILIALWFTNSGYAESGRPWVPFQANKLGMLTVALLAPRLWAGALCIAAYAGTAFVQMATFSPSVQLRMALGEPWATLATALFALVLLAYLLRRMNLEQQVARAEAEAAAMQRFARRLLALRDLANTPLQTITFATELARRKHLDLETLFERVDRAVERMQGLDQLFREYEDVLDWDATDQKTTAPG